MENALPTLQKLDEMSHIIENNVLSKSRCTIKNNAKEHMARLHVDVYNKYQFEKSARSVLFNGY